MTWASWTPPAAAFSEAQKLVLQSWRIVNQSYLDTTFNHQNWWSLRQEYLRRPLESRDQAYDAIREMLATLDDPFTRLLEPEQYRSLQVNTSGELSGVGLQINIDDESQQIEVITPIAGSPADAAGIEPRDRILEIDNRDATQLSLEEAANQMRGTIGTEVTLTILRPKTQQQKRYTIVRDRIALNPVTAHLDTESASLPIGYVRLAQFSANATAEMHDAIADLEKQGATGFILDLRNNPGGLLQAGVEIARLWLNDSPIVYTVNRQGVLGSFDAKHQALTTSPLVVLVNQGTASASEILAGALQDNERAPLVGDRTFGKGLIQSLFELPDNAGLAVTVAKYETPNHRDINKQGITPNYTVTQEAIPISKIGTKADTQYQEAIKVLTQKTMVAQS
ncbi:MAG: S41 family peptidase [Jaaginema sp. PMC 1079.18]|nr:S41 family peptidase [Jaaginema sp. PMC 1080.18]MEC4849690.1 S41 family peptidase [Jaaginema sp. PMC 1079.18]MEC4866173.1 S41 family peptidase [Jaaginema sp. PMC 1078.18]